MYLIMASLSENEQTAQFLWSISKRLSSTCPALSRYYICSLERKLINELPLLKKDIKRNYLYCNHCGSLWTHENHSVRIAPPPTANRHIKTLLKCEASEPWKLNNRQKKKLKKFRDSTSKIIYTCKICHKSTVFPGITKYGRKEISKLAFTTSVPKIKCKKGDLNAGLYVKMSLEKETQDKSILDFGDNSFLSIPSPKVIEKVAGSTENENPHSSLKSNLNFSKIESAMDNRLFTKHLTPGNLHQAPYSSSSHKTLSSQKKKKSLLAQILNEEKSSTKKKNSLSSFLVSL